MKMTRTEKRIALLTIRSHVRDHGRQVRLLEEENRLQLALAIQAQERIRALEAEVRRLRRNETPN